MGFSNTPHKPSPLGSTAKAITSKAEDAATRKAEYKAEALRRLNAAGVKPITKQDCVTATRTMERIPAHEWKQLMFGYRRVEEIAKDRARNGGNGVPIAMGAKLADKVVAKREIDTKRNIVVPRDGGAKKRSGGANNTSRQNGSYPAPSWDDRVGFGKFKDFTLRELYDDQRNYWNWAVENVEWFAKRVAPMTKHIKPADDEPLW